MADSTNWEGQAGGRGIRALTRYIYQPPPGENLTELSNMFSRMTGFMIVSSKFEQKHGFYFINIRLDILS